MTKFDYTITKEKDGIHSRPSGLIAKLAKLYPDTLITIEKNGVVANAAHLIEVMSLCIQNQETVTVAADGASEDDAIKEMKNYFKKCL